MLLLIFVAATGCARTNDDLGVWDAIDGGTYIHVFPAFIHVETYPYCPKDFVEIQGMSDKVSEKSNFMVVFVALDSLQHADISRKLRIVAPRYEYQIRILEDYVGNDITLFAESQSTVVLSPTL